jgi:hypothetical protein
MSEIFDAARNTAATVAVAVTAVVLTPLGSPEARGAQTGVAPGDEIDSFSDATQTRCTLGYTFTDPASSTTYGITAGHCDENSSYVQDAATGAVGQFVVSVAEPDILLGDDYGLINFGTEPAVSTVNGMPITGVGMPDPQQNICHSGLSTGVTCGQMGNRLAANQYAATGNIQNSPGDSGGPVWQYSSQGTATVVGIWLGERITGNGKRFGRFAALPDVLSRISAKTNSFQNGTNHDDAAQRVAARGTP